MLGFEFGEKPLWKMRPRAGHQEKLNARWGHGLFLGIRRASGELIVAGKKTKKVQRVRTARMVQEEQRWETENLEWVQAVPWNKGTDDTEADGDVPVFV